MTENTSELVGRVAELESALADERRVVQALEDVGTALGPSMGLDELLELILAKVRELIEPQKVMLFVVDESKGELVSRVERGESLVALRLPSDQGIAGLVVRTGREVRIENLQQDERYESSWERLRLGKSASVLAVPLKNHLSRTIGVLMLSDSRKSGRARFDEQALAKVKALASLAAASIDNSTLFMSQVNTNRQLQTVTRKLQRRVNDLQLLFELEQSTGRVTSLDELLLAALKHACRACSAEAASIVIRETENSPPIMTLYHTESEQLQRFEVDMSSGLVGVAVQNETATIFERAWVGELRAAGAEHRFSWVIENALGAQLEGDREAAGALLIYDKIGAEEFANDDRAILTLIAANISTAIRLFIVRSAQENSARFTALGKVLAEVIHDLKTPMTIISGFAQLMSRESEQSKRDVQIAEILKQFRGLTGMQKELMEFVRGERRVLLRRVFIRDLMLDLQSQLGLLIDGRAVELELDYDTKLAARIDQGRMVRALMNLSRNAIEAMSEKGGRLLLKAQGDASQVILEVSDTGPGIPERIKKRLFQPLMTEGKEGGTGLGLPIVKEVIEEHGGTIVVSSSPKGTTFRIVLPQNASDLKNDPTSDNTPAKLKPVEVKSRAQAAAKKTAKKVVREKKSTTKRLSRVSQGS